MDNNIEELANDLGIDINEEDDNSTTNVEVSNIDTKEQIEASTTLVEECKIIYKKARENDLSWRWNIGQKVNDAYANESNYEKGVLKRLSEELDISISDLSRFKKLYNSFTIDLLINRADVGYTWSHFKIINDLPDGGLKSRMITLVEEEDEAPKTKELQQVINEEKDSQFNDDVNTNDKSNNSSEFDNSSTPSPVKPVNGALKLIDKLNDCLSDIFMQEETGIDWDTDNKEQKYNEKIDELKTRIDETMKISDKIWKKD
jgi:hypothetical protein